MTAVAEDRGATPDARPHVAPWAADRAALARAVLARAEERTGTARWAPRPAVVAGPVAAVVDGSPAGSSPGCGDDAGLERPDRPERHDGTDPVSAARLLPVAPEVSALLPSGGLDRGTTLVVGGSTALVLAMVAEASRSGSWVAMVGLPRVGVLAAHQTGLDLERLVLVPDPGPDGPVVVAALLDGVDVVVVGDVALTGADRRRLSARARERGAVLLATGQWPGAQVVLTVVATRWEGLGLGHGRLRERRQTVVGTGRGAAARGWRSEVTLPVGRVHRADGGHGSADTRPSGSLGVLGGRRAG